MPAKKQKGKDIGGRSASRNLVSAHGQRTGLSREKKAPGVLGGEGCYHEKRNFAEPQRKKKRGGRNKIISSKKVSLLATKRHDVTLLLRPGEKKKKLSQKVDAGGITFLHVKKKNTIKEGTVRSLQIVAW